MSHQQFLDSLASHGFCLVPGVIPATDCVTISRRLQDVVSRAETGSPAPACIGFVPGVINHDQSFAAFLAEPRLLKLCTAVLGHDVRISFTSVIVNQPGNQRGGWHADWPFNQTNAGHVSAPYPDQLMHLTTLWMISEFTERNGGTLVVPASHRLPTNPTAADCDIDAQDSHPDEERVTGPAGSVLVMDSRLWHATAPNSTETDRVALAVRYAPWWLNTEILRPGSDTRRQLVDEPGLSDNQVPSLPRQVYDSLPTDVQPLYRHWIEP